MIAKKKSVYIILLLTLSLILFGCNRPIDQEENIEPQIEEKRKPVVGGELVIPITQFETLNPLLSTNESIFYFDQLVYDGLIKLDNKFQPQPSLAIEWEPAENGSGWTFQLRNDVLWHDGQLFTAEDVKFTIDALRAGSVGNNKSIYSAFVRNIKNVTVLGKNRISIEVDSPVNNSLEIFQFPIIPKHKYATSDEVFKVPKDILVGTGRYKVESYTKPNNIRLKVNEGYWGQKPYIPTIIGKIVPDYESALTSVEANEASVAKAIDLDWEKFGEDKTLKTYEFTGSDYEFLGFNFNRVITADKSIRTAIAYGIDRHAIVNDLYLGHATITDTPIHPNSWLNDESAIKYGRELAKAKKILVDANWKDENKDGILENESGNKLALTLLVNNDNPKRVDTSTMIATQLKEIGIEVMVEKVNWEEYQYRLYAGGYDMVLGGWQMSVIPNLNFLFHSAYKGNTNFIGYTNPDLDQKLLDAAFSKSPEERRQKYREIQNTVLEDIPYYSLFYKNSALIAKDYVKGNIDPKPNNIYMNIEQWYVLDEVE